MVRIKGSRLARLLGIALSLSLMYWYPRSETTKATTPPPLDDIFAEEREGYLAKARVPLDDTVAGFSLSPHGGIGATASGMVFLASSIGLGSFST